jgi:hypothetical protein
MGKSENRPDSYRENFENSTSLQNDQISGIRLTDFVSSDFSIIFAAHWPRSSTE